MKFTTFQVFNYRNIHDSGRIKVGEITAFVGQNEAGKSNLFEALYRVNPFDEQAAYNIDEDWPVDRWGDKDEEAEVCFAYFELEKPEIDSLFDFALPRDSRGEEGDSEKDQEEPPRPNSLVLYGVGYYEKNKKSAFFVEGEGEELLDRALVDQWAKQNIPKFVYIHDYEMSGAQIELNSLKERRAAVSWDQLTPDEQTISVVLDLAEIDLDDFLAKGTTAEGRTTRSFDKRAASAYLSKQFQELWRQKDVRFEIEIDATTLNIFAQDQVVGMPVRLNRRSTGFRWYVAFAWKFTHASKGQFKNCVLLLEETKGDEYDSVHHASGDVAGVERNLPRSRRPLPYVSSHQSPLL